MKPYFSNGVTEIYLGDCREVLPQFVSADVLIADPPYGETSFPWDKPVRGWLDFATAPVLWHFGSLRFFLKSAELFKRWNFAQDLIWKKHNGSSFHADRFRRVHEHIVQFYQGKWGAIYKCPPKTFDARRRTRRTKDRPPHMGHIDATPYVSVDGGPRLQRTILEVRSCHGRAKHPTQKPLEVIRPLIEYSCPPNGLVIDPFMGSGSSLVAAQNLGRRAVGIEVQERYCEVAAQRLMSEGR